MRSPIATAIAATRRWWPAVYGSRISPIVVAISTVLRIDLELRDVALDLLVPAELLRHVLDHAEQGGAALVQGARPRHLHGDLASVLADGAAGVAVVGSVALENRAPELEHPFMLVFRDRDQGIDRHQVLGGVVAEDLREPRVRVGPLAVLVHVDAGERLLDEASVAGLRRRKRVLRANAMGDLLERAGDSRGRPAWGGVRARPVAEPADFAIDDDPVLDVEALALERRAEGAGQGFAVPGGNEGEEAGEFLRRACTERGQHACGMGGPLEAPGAGLRDPAADVGDGLGAIEVRLPAREFRGAPLDERLEARLVGPQVEEQLRHHREEHAQRESQRGLPREAGVVDPARGRRHAQHPLRAGQLHFALQGFDECGGRRFGDDRFPSRIGVDAPEPVIEVVVEHRAQPRRHQGVGQAHHHDGETPEVAIAPFVLDEYRPAADDALAALAKSEGSGEGEGPRIPRRAGRAPAVGVVQQVYAERHLVAGERRHAGHDAPGSELECDRVGVGPRELRADLAEIGDPALRFTNHQFQGDGGRHGVRDSRAQGIGMLAGMVGSEGAGEIEAILLDSPHGARRRRQGQQEDAGGNQPGAVAMAGWQGKEHRVHGGSKPERSG